jgi:hypothetical protein
MRDEMISWGCSQVRHAMAGAEIVTVCTLVIQLQSISQGSDSWTPGCSAWYLSRGITNRIRPCILDSGEPILLNPIPWSMT